MFLPDLPLTFCACIRACQWPSLHVIAMQVKRQKNRHWTVHHPKYICIVLLQSAGSRMQLLCKPVFRWGLFWKPNASTMAWFAAWLGLLWHVLAMQLWKTEQLHWQWRGLRRILQCDVPEGETQIPAVLDSNILNLRWCVHNHRVRSLNWFIPPRDRPR